MVPPNRLPGCGDVPEMNDGKGMILPLQMLLQRHKVGYIHLSAGRVSNEVNRMFDDPVFLCNRYVS